MAPVFECKKCGCCCQGRGGIVVSERDLARLAAFLGITEEAALDTYVEVVNGKRKIRSGADGYCCFFHQNTGCVIHGGKPDICRAWPFFRGNLLDEVSFDLARDYCPGINRETDFATFRRAGLIALKDADLRGESQEANALKISDAIFDQFLGHDSPAAASSQTAKKAGEPRLSSSEPLQDRPDNDLERISKDMGGRHVSAHEAN